MRSCRDGRYSVIRHQAKPMAMVIVSATLCRSSCRLGRKTHEKKFFKSIEY